MFRDFITFSKSAEQDEVGALIRIKWETAGLIKDYVISDPCTIFT